MEGVMIRGWEFIIHGCEGASTLSRGATNDAGWRNKPCQSEFSPQGWGFHTLRGGIDFEDVRFYPRVVGIVHVWKDLGSRGGTPGRPLAP